MYAYVCTYIVYVSVYIVYVCMRVRRISNEFDEADRWIGAAVVKL